MSSPASTAPPGIPPSTSSTGPPGGPPPGGPPPGGSSGQGKSLETALGGLVVGIFVEMIILGVVLGQVSYYSPRSSNDPILLKILVGVLLFSLMFKAGLDVRTVYSDLLFPKAGHGGLSWTGQCALVVAEVPIIASQFYLAYRLYAASERRKIPAAFGIFGSLFATAFFLVCSVKRISEPPQSQDPTLYQYWLPLWAFSTAAVDLYLSALFTYFLLRARKQAISYRLDFVLLRLASLAITTCFPPAFISVVMAILLITMPNRSPWLFFSVILAGTYSMCIMYTLNSRQQISNDAARGVVADPIARGRGSQAKNYYPSSNPPHPDPTQTQETNRPKTHIISLLFDAMKSSLGGGGNGSGTGGGGQMSFEVDQGTRITSYSTSPILDQIPVGFGTVQRNSLLHPSINTVGDVEKDGTLTRDNDE